MFIVLKVRRLPDQSSRTSTHWRFLHLWRWCFCSRNRYFFYFRSVDVWRRLGLIMHWCCWLILWWSAPVCSYSDTSDLLVFGQCMILVCGAYWLLWLEPTCFHAVTWLSHHCLGVEALYHCVYHSKLSLAAFFSKSAPWLLVLVKLFSICGP